MHLQTVAFVISLTIELLFYKNTGVTGVRGIN